MTMIKILPHEELCPDGKSVSVNPGANLCKALLAAGVEIEHACDMSKACTTCHVIVRNGFNSLTEADEIEEDLLDRSWGVTAVSRLSCQVKVSSEDLTIEIPKYTINHAKEG